MKQGKIYTKVVLWVFLGAVVFYFGYYIFSAVYDPLTTAVALEYEAGSGSYTTGYVLRDETLVRTRHGITTMVVSEGERVSRGQVLATGYLNSTAQQREERIEELELQLEQLKYATAFSADVASQNLLDSEIQSQLVQMNRFIARRDMNSAADRSPSIKGLVLRRMSSEKDNAAMDERITAIKEELASLQAETSGDTISLTAVHSGYFSGSVDGYETILTMDAMRSMTTEGFYEIMPGAGPTDAIGKLITGSTWYYVTVVPTAQTKDVRVGQQVPISFASDFHQDLVMKVERLGKDVDGSRLLILSCDKYMQEATLLREQSADVVFSSYSGLQVPKEAVRVHEETGLPGVYILEGSMAAWKNIEILYDNGESYVVRKDKSSTDNLWPGDEIIVGAKNLKDGKVVR